MKALVYTAPHQLEYRDVDGIQRADDHVLIKVEYVGICGSDMHAFLGHDERRPAPLILGHEAAGIIVDGEGEGKRVTVNPLVTCGECPACQEGLNNLCAKRQIISMPPREGAFAEYIQMPVSNLVEVPDDVPLEKAALAEPIACGWNAARKSIAYLGGEAQTYRALVIGGGAIGVGAALSLRAQGVDQIVLVEPHDARRDFIAETMGIDARTEAALDSEFDIVIDGVGFAATRALACKYARPGGVIAHIGLGSAEGGLDVRKMTLQEITFIGCYTYTPRDFRETAKAIFSGALGGLEWTDIRPLKDGAQAFADIKSGTVIRPKLILKP